jgi:hypothetical protein
LSFIKLCKISDRQNILNLHVQGILEKLKHAHLQSIITANQNGLLPTGVGKCQHLPKWFGKSPKWKRLQTFSGLLPLHYGKC